MKRNQIYFFLLFLICLISIYQFIGFGVSTIENQQNKAYQAYRNALAYTRIQLTGLSKEVVQDPTLIENLEWDLEYSVHKSLEGALRPGEMESITIVDSQCTVMSHASLNGRKATCDRSKLSNKEYFYWDFIENKSAQLSVHHSFETKSGKKMHAIASVILDQEWINQQQDLLVLFHNLELAIGPNEKNYGSALIAREGFNSENKAIATLWSQDWRLIMIDRLHLQGQAVNQSLLFVFFLLGLATIGFLWWDDVKNNQSLNAALDSLINWLRKEVNTEDEPRNNGSSSGPGSGGLFPYANQTSIEQCTYFKELVMQLQKEHASDCSVYKSNIAALQAQLRGSEAQTKELTLRIDDNTYLESLGLQVGRGSEQLHNNLNQIRDAAEDLSDTIVHGVARNNQMLSGLIRNWKLEVQQKGVRKFVRSLSENLTQTGCSELEEQMERLFILSEAATDQILASAGFAQKLLSKTQDLERFGGHWYELTHLSAANVESSSLLELASLAQVIFSGDEHFVHQFRNDFALTGTTIEHFGAPRSVWISLLFHTYAALIEEFGTEENLNIQNQFSEFSDPGIGLRISTQIQVMISSASVIKQLSQSQHIQVAAKLILRFGGKLEYRVNQVDNSICIDLAWPQLNQRVPVNSSQKQINASVLNEEPRHFSNPELSW